MRLTCPKCAARYEIADDLIPAGGRDVQCSNCEAVWLVAKAEQAPADPERAPANVEPFRQPGRQQADRDDAATDDVEDGAEGDAEDATPAPARVSEARPSEVRPLEDRHGADVIATLREERAYEDRMRAVARSREGGVDPGAGGTGGSGPGRRGSGGVRDVTIDGSGAVHVGSLADLFAPDGSDDPGGPGPRERARMAAAAAHARERDGKAAPQPASQSVPPSDTPASSWSPPTSRAATLPDIAPDAERLDRRAAGRRPPPIFGTEPEPEERPGGGGRALSMTLLLVIAAAAAVYLFAPEIVAQVPDLAEPLDDYVGVVDGQLANAERGVEAATAWLESLIAE